MTAATMVRQKTASEKTLLAMGHTGFFQRRTAAGTVVSISSEWSTDPTVGMSKRFAIELHDYLTHKYVRGYVVELKVTEMPDSLAGIGGTGTLVVATQSSEGKMGYSTGIVTDNDRVASVYDSDSKYLDVLHNMGGNGSQKQLQHLADTTAFLAKKLITVQNPLNKLLVEENAQIVMLLTEIGKSAEFLAANGFKPIPHR